jgi:hypothetical protein
MREINRWRLAGFVVMGALCVVPIVRAAMPRAWNEGGCFEWPGKQKKTKG